MLRLSELIRKLIDLRSKGIQITLLAVCPNSEAVLEAAVAAAVRANAPMLFAATLNQVDRDGGYTGWTQETFVKALKLYAAQYDWPGPLYPCLDHGGPWLKDMHPLQGHSLAETMDEVKMSLTASLKAGYNLLHIDPTVDRTLLPGEAINISVVADRTVELIAYAEQERIRLELPPVDYEVGTEEVHGGLVDRKNFDTFLKILKKQLTERQLMHAWPCFIVAKVGTDIHTSFFDPAAAENLTEMVRQDGSLIKGHYTDWVDNPEAYPSSGMGGANVGPEFTAVEYRALQQICLKEAILCQSRPEVSPSGFMETLKKAVVDSERWEKWRQPDEESLVFEELSNERRDWLVQTGARYIWTNKEVLRARARLYHNLEKVMPSPHQFVIEEIVRSIDKYISAFNLFDSLFVLESRE